MPRICIPDYEYKERIARAAALVRERGLDVMVVSSTESDYANARYFSGFWPLFERAGVAISANGEAALMVGPESAIFAADRSKIEKIFVLREFRESADPAYPELKADTQFTALQDQLEGAENRISEGKKRCFTPLQTRLSGRRKSSFQGRKSSICIFVSQY